MDGEFGSFIKVWVIAITCLCYCYYIASKIPKGFLRLLSIIPVIYIFLILPLNLSSPSSCSITCFLLVWLGTFKLLLFSFNQGPLVLSHPNIAHFISIASLPIELKQQHPPTQKTTTPEVEKPKWHMLLKVLLLTLILCVYSYKERLPPQFIIVLYCCHVYLSAEITFALCAVAVRTIFGCEIEPQFNKPYLCTSLQDFWGRRWNLTVTHILRPTVYDPVRRISTQFVGPTCAKSAAMLTTFLVSGLMHELIYYYVSRAPPTWEVTCYFVLHGVCTAAEVVVKKVMLRRGWRLPRAMSGPLVVAFVVITGRWLFFAQILRNGVNRKAIREYAVLLVFVKSKLPLHLLEHQILSILMVRNLSLMQ
ncbi:probable long-chain-alcohol O-fatty-acyltransferase 1 [Abrus precatorius]|uniref:Probable long-chain-alcohol O-fatty-acyltransferase 1 n=1 Tax=Abrus precatorius TaxID=3816 RepID=A0A8B8KDI2_ABRPR|nr:probable long-chain-alcohol O-fatty-acyltransferase 1 [Abrus precatorius]